MNQQLRMKKKINNNAHQQLLQVHTFFPAFTTTCWYVYTATAVQIRAQHFSQLKTVGRAETFET